MAEIQLFCKQCGRTRQLTVRMGKPVRRLPCEHFLDELGASRGCRMGLTHDRMIWVEFDDD